MTTNPLVRAFVGFVPSPADFLSDDTPYRETLKDALDMHGPDFHNEVAIYFKEMGVDVEPRMEDMYDDGP